MSIPKINIEWDRISLTDIVQIVLILGMIYAGWLRFDQRVATLESMSANSAVHIKEATEAINRLTVSLDKLQYTLEVFPPHRHTGDGDIEYPDGHEGRIDGHSGH